MPSVVLHKDGGLLRLVWSDTRAVVYTVPRHVRLPSRDAVRWLADHWTQNPDRIGNVEDIMAVERQCQNLRARERKYRQVKALSDWRAGR
ncbi:MULTISPECIES: hypothetical protein [unclassified Chelatococcus]|uniref:hypothetical protein n=1 Tax=unclassified Chelatococcus TaxID=2638111 RepID=UPI001BCC9081|nr:MULTISPECIES: hypothetical protein [unclassified Chelatococcus]CAH1665702.1 hypothetical protein CHELA41_22708 [Hyphomicrobiales bacterium]MBS7737758.1 hypothetical protein [Chelatococcus sp. HY11]MBX3547246.1 hypothetical protein [Chelatococcus sp.]MCO5077114.1 hypothetical protein [Chelatococcus sp.]CAH1681164.1 hypothetical protein CHELA20_52212 [Hyphomicrobiales bacterium]